MPSTGTITLKPFSAAVGRGVQHRGLRLRAHRDHGLDALVLERLLQVAVDELVGTERRQHLFAGSRRQRREDVGRHRIRHRDAVDDQRALGARLGDELDHLRHLIRATLAALRRAGLLGEVHHQDRGFLGVDLRRLQRRRRRKLGRAPFLDQGLRLNGRGRGANGQTCAQQERVE